jgi:hypothetical protein
MHQKKELANKSLMMTGVVETIKLLKVEKRVELLFQMTIIK